MFRSIIEIFIEKKTVIDHFIGYVPSVPKIKKCKTFNKLRTDMIQLSMTKQIHLRKKFVDVNASRILKRISGSTVVNSTKALKGKTEEKESSNVTSKDDGIEKKIKEKPIKKTKGSKQEIEENIEDTEVVEKPKRGTRRGQTKDQEEVISKKRKTKEKQIEVEQEETISQKDEVAKSRTSKKKKREVNDSSSDEKPNGNATKKEAKSKGQKVKKAQAEHDAVKDEDSEDPSENEESGTNEKGRKRKARSKVNKKEPKSKSVPMNATATKWEDVDFKCHSKNSKGKSANFHITSWNVDGLRAWMKKGGLNIIQYDQPDIFCIQETKCALEKLPDEVKTIDGYETFWCSSDKDGYAGVGIATKIKPLSVIYGINSEELDSEGRCITAEYESFFLVNVYVPNAGRKLVTLPKRLEWNELFKEHVRKLDERKPVIICGDMNVAHTEIDLANPKTNTKNAGFTIEEREGMTDFLESGYVDTFRKLYPDKEKVYTFWTYMANARSKNVGWRLDYFIVSDRLMEEVCDNVIHSDVLGSDHCPLSLHIKI